MGDQSGERRQRSRVLGGDAGERLGGRQQHLNVGIL